jgi:hypothetical protein
MNKVKQPRMTVKEINMQAARSKFPTPPTDPYEIAEAAVLLRDQYKQTRLNIASILGIRSAEVLTAYKRFDEGSAKGIIPTGKIDVIAEDPHQEVVEDEDSRRERLALAKETKSIVQRESFETKLATAIANVMPDKKSMAELKKHTDELYAKVNARLVRKGKPVEDAMATISDLHLCLDTGHHSTQRGLDALNRFTEKVMHLTDLHRHNFTVDTLHLNALGDNIQGTANYASQKWDVDRPSIEQVEALTEALVGTILTFLTYYKTVNVNFALGNHGYIVSKKTSPDPESSNWEMVVARSVRWAFTGNSRVHINVPDDWYTIVDVQGNKFMLTHGHAISGSGKFDGIIDTVQRWSAIVPKFHYCIIGHFHRCASLPIPTQYGERQRQVYMNGTAVDSDDFLQKFGGSPTPQWWLFFIDKHGITSEHKVHLYGRGDYGTK